MSSSKFRLLCLVLPDDDPDAHTFRVEVDHDEIVATLKELIKVKHAPNLAHVPAHNLVLWKCAGLPEDDLEQTLKSIQFDGSDDRLIILNKGRQQISQFFGSEDLSKEPIHILVQVPAFCECDTRIFCSMMKGLGSSQMHTPNTPVLEPRSGASKWKTSPPSVRSSSKVRVRYI